jgi:hypothetical protein
MGDRKAPVDEYGMPYAIVPCDPPDKGCDLTETEHHAFYNARAEELAYGLGYALRVSRVHDKLPAWIHGSYHKKFYYGLERFPESESETFGLLILSCAGYLSRLGWHRKIGGVLELEEMGYGTYQKLRGRNYLHPETITNSRIPFDGKSSRRTQDQASRTIGEALTIYAREQDLSHLKNKDFVDEFLNTKNVNRRHQLGRLILKEAATVAVEPIRPKFEQALNAGNIRLPVSDPAQVVTRFAFAGSWLEHEAILYEKLIA